MALTRALLAVLVATCVLTNPLPGQAGKSKSSQKAPASRSPEDSTIDVLQRESVKFFELWSKLWKQSQTSAWSAGDGKKYPAPFRQNPRRTVFQHCHDVGFTSARQEVMKLPGEYVPVRSTSAFSVCPTWLLSDDTEYIKGLSAEESDSADAAISVTLVDSVRRARGRLIDAFDRAQHRFPGGSAITGQRVRLLLDQSLRDSAQVVAQSCGDKSTFCVLLQGYVEARRANIRQAATLFDAAVSQMSAAERCGWDDIIDLLPDSVHVAYQSLSCTPRRKLVAQYWWLADPLYSDSVNERHVEQDARRMRILLLRSLPQDGRFFYGRKAIPPDALFKTVTRYGWPTYLAWGGRDTDESHSGWLMTFGGDTQPPYTTYEYSKGRIHTAAALEAINSPLSATDSSWDLNAGSPKEKSADWWPDEHMVRERPLLTLPAYQIAMLRRETDIMLASAHDLNAAAFAGLRARGVATLMVTPDPDTIVRLATRFATNAPTLRMQGRIPSARTLFALEISDTVARGIDARTRIGIEPPITLSAMKRGQVALSEPIIVELAARDGAPLEPGTDLLNRMLGSTTISLSVNSRIGVFFESYGVNEGDTVSVSVTLRRTASVSALRRLGMALNVANDPNASVTITWKEPNAAHVTRTVGGTVPIQARAIALDISALSSGPYELVTGIKRGAQPEVLSSRRVAIVK